MRTADLVTKYNHIFHTDYTADANCVIAYLFLEGSGTTVDNAQGTAANDGVFKGTGEPAWDATDVPYHTTGSAPNSVIYDGSNDYIRFPGSAVSLNIGSLSVLAKPHFASNELGTGRYFFDTDTARHAFFHKDYDDNSADLIEMYNDGRYTDFAVSWAANTVHHFVFLYNKTGNVQQLYLDGILITGSGSGTWGTSALGTNAHIGERINTTEVFDGGIAEVGLFSDILTSTEINEIYDYGLKPSGGGAVGVNIHQLIMVS